MAFNLMLLFCFVAVMNNGAVPSSARKLKSTTSPEVVTSIEDEHHQKVEADPRSNYKVEKKEEKYDKNQLFPPIIPLPPLPLPPSFPLPTPVPGLPWPRPPSLPFPPVPITDAHFPAPSPPT
ncbi:hypothetical protein PHAVU_009G218700 [Phaseolus vulgaris]|uniref:Uncharacterized protein n=1 Tax=Phaseolus vulgaris TaxID=3885 RepID=V7AY79_PHAVU|nr:hypothetical protein PHAVU_009G218700g [Phaseolus vulgaris]ESW10544.1 hypothetical protein PHAVU_009G218700g [Phaseolus vulgaris]